MKNARQQIVSIRKEFRRSPEARYVHRLHAVLLVLSGMTCTAAARLLNDPIRSVAHWVSTFEEGGMDCLKDGAKPGRPTKLNDRQKCLLATALGRSPKQYGLHGERWTGLLVKEFLEEKLQASLTHRQCLRLLHVHKRITTTES